MDTEQQAANQTEGLNKRVGGKVDNVKIRAVHREPEIFYFSLLL